MLPKYILGHNRQGLPAPIILCTQPPYHIGKVWTFKNPQEYLDCINNNNFLAYKVIDGYMIVISYDGTLSGKMIQVEPGLKKQLENLLIEMENFYRQERIEDKPGYYQKFKL